jgi:hypothetical protein
MLKMLATNALLDKNDNPLWVQGLGYLRYVLGVLAAVYAAYALLAVYCSALRLLRRVRGRTTGIGVALSKLRGFDHCLLRAGLGAAKALMLARCFSDTHYYKEDEAAPAGHALKDLGLSLFDADGNAVPHGTYGAVAIRNRHLSNGYHSEHRMRSADSADSSKRLYLGYGKGYFDEQGCPHHAGH